MVLIFGFSSGFVCAALLLRYLTGDRRASAAGAIMYAFCPYVMSHLAHIQLLMTGGIPLSLLMLHRVADAASLQPFCSFRLGRKILSRGVALGWRWRRRRCRAYYGSSRD